MLVDLLGCGGVDAEVQALHGCPLRECPPSGQSEMVASTWVHERPAVGGRTKKKKKSVRGVQSQDRLRPVLKCDALCAMERGGGQWVIEGRRAWTTKIARLLNDERL